MTGLDAEETAAKFFEILEKVARNESPVEKFSNFIEILKNGYVEEDLDFSDFLEDVFQDVICEAVNEIINDHDWRSDQIGPKAITNPDTLRVLFENLIPIDQNIEVVFATNPYTPKDLLISLCESDFDWEEDSTTSAIARNTSDGEILKKLLINADQSTKFSLASNLSIPLELFAILAQDEGFSNHKLYWARFDGLGLLDCSVKFAILSNPNTPNEILERFASGEFKFEDVRLDDREQLNADLKTAARNILQKRSQS
jgi:hypothetical protein